MNNSATGQSWFGPTVLNPKPQARDDPHEFGRMWQGFMTARLILGFVLLTLQGALYATGTSHSNTLIAICAAYFLGTLATRFWAKPRPLGSSFNSAWGLLVGLDLLVFSALQLLQGNGGVNYTPLFALPILLVSVLGSLRLALGTAAGVTVLLLSGTLWTYLQGPTDVTPQFVQSALGGAGYFVIALLANQLSTRLVSEGKRARLNQLAANVQRQVNALVIESLPDGVLIVDDRGHVRAANPAARQLLGSERALNSTSLDLRDESGWLPLLDLTRLTVGTGQNQEDSITIRHDGHSPLRVRVRTRLATPMGPDGDGLCVLFLQDQRELEARMRTEKLASMGRMSTAVAHEIRNPLAAIAQANALLDEDIEDPKLKRLTQMVGQNAKRLEKIVDDILNVSRVHPHDRAQSESAVQLNQYVYRVCMDWAEQSGSALRLKINLPEPDLMVLFDAEQLRRVLVNLLDNARRYASNQCDAIQVNGSASDPLRPAIAIWSDGAPMDQSMERHLFEPFFSSESRSSGLGLFICRELCEGHGATIVYERNTRSIGDRAVDGNEFIIAFRSAPPSEHAHIQEIPDAPWQTTLY